MTLNLSGNVSVYCFFNILAIILNFHSKVQNQTHVYMKILNQKDLGNHLLQLCPQLINHSVHISNIFLSVITQSV
jgi:hypothetical protein